VKVEIAQWAGTMPKTRDNCRTSAADASPSDEIAKRSRSLFTQARIARLTLAMLVGDMTAMAAEI
jgi:hypothetical protein